MDSNVKAWCQRQCEMQHATTEDDFAGMEAAWIAAADGEQTVSLNVIKGFAELIDPVANPNGQFRKGPAVFMDGGTSLPAHRIESQLMELLSSQDVLPPWFMYRELMFIHPFKDGNGRVGALVYNMLNGTIDNPVDAPPYK